MKALKVVSLVISLIKKSLSLLGVAKKLFVSRKEKEKKAKKRKIFWTVFLSVVGVILVVLFFPYRFVVKRNGDFEIRTLILNVYRKSPEYNIPEGGSDSFDIEEAVEEEDVLEA
jgi:uncharacterized membrane protein